LLYQVLGSDNLLIWSSDLTTKPARSTECFGWHQDEAYADLGNFLADFLKV
jgi:hypothetical protein